jgi:hypothetical protein
MSIPRRFAGFSRVISFDFMVIVPDYYIARDSPRMHPRLSLPPSTALAMEGFLLVFVSKSLLLANAYSEASAKVI